MPKKLWIRFATKQAYEQHAAELMNIIDDNGGRDQVVIYISEPRCIRQLPPGSGVRADRILLEKLGDLLGRENVTLQ